LSKNIPEKLIKVLWGMRILQLATALFKHWYLVYKLKKKVQTWVVSGI